MSEREWRGLFALNRALDEASARAKSNPLLASNIRYCGCGRGDEFLRQEAVVVDEIALVAAQLAKSPDWTLDFEKVREKQMFDKKAKSIVVFRSQAQVIDDEQMLMTVSATASITSQELRRLPNQFNSKLR
ncbi:unnamed protein product [Nippostrongylus brasiliensis]|uniref:DUF4359 domain-containing protein n=1 Tax=Nippostrongylus brasiliensis TaxID=27835 RepID=A0A0N4XUT4_NIPBR|nr:unnamed protein product [Nippostrongylus brasiliensis]